MCMCNLSGFALCFKIDIHMAFAQNRLITEFIVYGAKIYRKKKNILKIGSLNWAK